MISEEEQQAHPLPSLPQIERLVLLIEECGEVIQAASKILRHGYMNHHPDSPQPTNRTNLEKEIGDLRYVLSLMYDRQDIGAENTAEYCRQKEKKIGQWLRHNVSGNE